MHFPYIHPSDVKMINWADFFFSSLSLSLGSLRKVKNCAIENCVTYFIKFHVVYDENKRTFADNSNTQWIPQLKRDAIYRRLKSSGFISKIKI